MRSVQGRGRGNLTARAVIRDEALCLFAARGPAAVSLRQVAAAAGVSPGPAIHHFGFIGAMLALGALMAFAIIFTTMSVNIVERRRELATLRTAGVHRRAIAGLIAGENLLTTLLGVVPGLLIGILGGRAFLASYSSDQFRLDLVVRPLTLVVSALAILAVAALSQWPGLRAIGRLDLAQVVRERSG